MTLSNLQAAIHKLYAGDTSTPLSDSSEWEVRLAYINAGIDSWQTQELFWNELWTTLADASSGDKTVTASTLTYDCPDDFSFLGGYVETNGTKWRVIKPEKASVKKGDTIVGLEDGYVYVTGNPADGYEITFSSQPTVGDTIDYPYYKNATQLATGTDETEISDPYFLVYFAISKLHEHDGEGDRATFSMSQAETKMKAMKVRNALLPHYQPNQADDSTIIRTATGFGS
jgi:hypothetical protein